MNKRLLSVVLVIFVLTFSAFSIHAQDDFSEEELDAIAVVADAYDKMAALETVYTDGTQNLVQEVSAAGQSLEITLLQEIFGPSIFDEDAPAAALTIVQESTFSGISIEMTMEMIQVDDDLWVRISDVTDAYASQYPEGWVNLIENPTGVPGMELFNIDSMTSMTNTGLQYPITEDTVATIEELDDFEEIDGIETRAFAVTLDTLALLETEAFDALSGMMNADALGMDVNDMMTQMFENAFFDLVIWVGVDDGLVHRTDMILDIDAALSVPGAGSVNLVQSLEASFTYTEFDDPVEIVAPEE